MKESIRILLADDHALLRSGLKLLLERQGRCQVVGEAADGERAVQLFFDLQPDLLLLDLSMPKSNGIESLQQIKQRCPEAKILVLTMHDDKEYIKRAMEAGACGYVKKAAVDVELFSAIESVMAGNLYLSPNDSQALIQLLLKEQEEPDERDPYILLSQRERQVLRQIVYGYSLSEIAQTLAISVKTVETYKTRLMEKLAVTKKSGLVEYALRYGLLAAKDNEL
ncbi:MAG: response regulator transcription factor [Sporomusaceae bacterium]|nr:response regulator transcription factor [Sporomusaceae bacterium]